MNALFDALCIFVTLFVFAIKWKHDMAKQHIKTHRITHTDAMNRILNGNKNTTIEFILVMLFGLFSSSKLYSPYVYMAVGESAMLLCIALLTAAHIYVYIERDNKKLCV